MIFPWQWETFNIFLLSQTTTMLFHLLQEILRSFSTITDNNNSFRDRRRRWCFLYCMRYFGVCPYRRYSTPHKDTFNILPPLRRMTINISVTVENDDVVSVITGDKQYFYRNFGIMANSHNITLITLLLISDDTSLGRITGVLLYLTNYFKKFQSKVVFF